MSSFIISSKTMDSIVHGIWPNGSSTHCPPLPDDIIKLTGASTKQELGNRLYAMNWAAYKQRYGDGIMSELNGFAYKVGPTILYSREQTLKSLHCYAYQCCEGNVPDSPLFTALSHYKEEFAAWIVQSSPAYEKAEWDI